MIVGIRGNKISAAKGKTKKTKFRDDPLLFGLSSYTAGTSVCTNTMAPRFSTSARSVSGPSAISGLGPDAKRRSSSARADSSWIFWSYVYEPVFGVRCLSVFSLTHASKFSNNAFRHSTRSSISFLNVSLYSTNSWTVSPRRFLARGEYLCKTITVKDVFRHVDTISSKLLWSNVVRRIQFSNSASLTPVSAR